MQLGRRQLSCDATPQVEKVHGNRVFKWPNSSLPQKKNKTTSRKKRNYSSSYPLWSDGSHASPEGGNTPSNTQGFAHAHTQTHSRTRLNAGIHFLNPHSQIFTCLPGCLLHTNLHTHACLPRPAEFTHEGPEQTATRPSPHSQTPPGWLSRGAGDALKERCWRNSITQWWRIHNLTLHRSLLFPSPVSTRTGGGEKNSYAVID